jgi:hypothetical protein
LVCCCVFPTFFGWHAYCINRSVLYLEEIT